MWSLPVVTTTAEDRNCLRAIVGGHVTVTVQNFIVTIIRDIRTCIRIQLKQNIVLFQNIPTQSRDCDGR